MTLNINGVEWKLVFVPALSNLLTRSDGSRTVGMTDGNTHAIYISEDISGKFLKKVITHELCHANMISRDIYMSIWDEEILCDVIASYGEDILDLTRDIYNNLTNFNF